MSSSPIDDPPASGNSPAVDEAVGDDTAGTPPSGLSAADRPVRIHDLATLAQRGEKFVMLTAYDFLSAQILDEVGVPVLLVGDSLGMVALGYETTLPVTLDELAHHTAAVARGARRALVIADMPFGSFQEGPERALTSATRLVKQGGAHGVKLEGAGRVVDAAARLVEAGIPVMGHLGLTPQSVHQLGGYRVQARDEAAAQRLVADARALAEAGVFSIVLEAVPAAVGAAVTGSVEVPTIGIGAGGSTDGQVMVLEDMLGLTGGRQPRFVKQYASLRAQIQDAVKAFAHEVADSSYPAAEHQY